MHTNCTKNLGVPIENNQKSHLFIYPLCHYFHAVRTRYSFSSPYIDAFYEKKSCSTQNGHRTFRFTPLSWVVYQTDSFYQLLY